MLLPASYSKLVQAYKGLSWAGQTDKQTHRERGTANLIQSDYSKKKAPEKRGWDYKASKS